MATTTGGVPRARLLDALGQRSDPPAEVEAPALELDPTEPPKPDAAPTEDTPEE